MTTTTNTRSTTATAKAASKTASKTASQPRHDDAGLRLAALRDLKAVTLRGIPDVRGWPVELRDGVTIGSVVRILVDQQAEHRPRYLDLRIDPTRFGMTGAPWHSLLPIGRTELAKGRDVVLLPTIGREQLTVLRPLGEAVIDFPFEMGVARAFGLAVPMVNADDLYRTPLFDVDATMRLRRVAA